MSLKKNVISNFILTSSTILFPLITFPYVTRVLSSNGLGSIFFIDAFSQYFIILSSLGIPFYGVREIAKHKHDVKRNSDLVVELVILQFFLALACCCIFFALHFFIPKLGSQISLIQIACLSILSNSFLIEWYYQGIENFSYITKRSLIIKSLSVIAILVLVKQQDDYVLYFLILSLLVFANSFLNFYNFYKHFYKGWPEKLNLSIHLKPLLVLFSINVSISVYTVLDTVILGFFTTPVAVSFYNVPLKLVKMFWLLIAGIGTVLIPRMSVLHANKNNEAIKDLMAKSINVIFLIALPFSFFCVVFPKEILTIISGEKYLPAINVLRILSLIPLIIGLCNVFGTQYLLPIGQERKILHATILGLVVSLTANFILIPIYSFTGAAISCLLAELTVCVYIYIWARKNIAITFDYKLLSLIILSLLPSFLLTLGLKNYLSSLSMMALSIFVYIVSFILFQLLLFRNKFVEEIVSNILKFKK